MTTEPSAGPSEPPHQPGSQRDGCLTALMVIAGGILLLPGLCALVFINAMDGPETRFIGGDFLHILWTLCLLASVGGVVLLVKAFR
jgi:hypothetical protein